MGRKINLLMMEDSENDAILVLNSIERAGFDLDQFLRVDNIPDFRKALTHANWSVVFSDYHLPTLNGHDSLRVFNEAKLNIPFILVSGTIPDVEAVAILKEGANDFVSKSNLPRLPQVLTRELDEVARREDLRKAEEANLQYFNEVKRSHAFITEIFNSLQGIAVFTQPANQTNPTFSFISGSIELVTGFSAKEFMENSQILIERIHPDDREQANANRAQRTDGSVINEFRFQHKNGTWIDMLSKRRDVKLSGDPNSTTLGLFIDQTERIQTERARNAANAQMYQLNKLAELGEMAGTIAHEINNPLSIIAGKSAQFRELLEEGETNAAKLVPFAKVIQETTERIVKIVNGLRTISRKSEGDLFKKVSLHAIIDETFAFCAARFKYLDIPVSVCDFPKDLILDCRATELSQVLVNMLSNSYDAIEHLPEKWVKINVQEKGEWVEITIIDSGKGVPVEIRDKLTESFFTTKEPGKGTGLGLSISKRIVEAHNGTLDLDVNSANTCFCLRLPKNHA